MLSTNGPIKYAYLEKMTYTYYKSALHPLHLYLSTRENIGKEEEIRVKLCCKKREKVKNRLYIIHLSTHRYCCYLHVFPPRMRERCVYCVVLRFVWFHSTFCYFFLLDTSQPISPSTERPKKEKKKKKRGWGRGGKLRCK